MAPLRLDSSTHVVPKSSLKRIDCIRHEIKMAADDTNRHGGGSGVHVSGSVELTSRLGWIGMDL